MSARLVTLVAALSIGFAASPAAASAAPPANDDYANATVVGSLPFSDVVDTTGATTETGVDSGICGIDPTPPKSVWYSITLPAATTVSIDTTGSSYTPGVGVVTGSPGSFSSAACLLGSGTFQAEAGQTYHIVLVDFSASDAHGGSLHLSLTAEPPPVPPVVHVLPRAGLGSQGGNAIVQVRYSCTGVGNLSVDLVQHHGAKLIRADGSLLEADCDGDTHVGRVILEDQGPYALVKRPSSVTARLDTFDSATSQEFQTVAGPRTITPSRSVKIPAPAGPLSIRGMGRVTNQGGGAVISVNYMCASGAQVFVRLAQRRGARLALASGDPEPTELVCDGARHTARISLFNGTSVALKAGTAEVVAQYHSGEVAFETGPRDVTLHR